MEATTWEEGRGEGKAAAFVAFFFVRHLLHPWKMTARSKYIEMVTFHSCPKQGMY